MYRTIQLGSAKLFVRGSLRQPIEDFRRNPVMPAAAQHDDTEQCKYDNDSPTDRHLRSTVRLPFVIKEHSPPSFFAYPPACRPATKMPGRWEKTKALVPFSSPVKRHSPPSGELFGPVLLTFEPLDGLAIDIRPQAFNEKVTFVQEKVRLSARVFAANRISRELRALF